MGHRIDGSGGGVGYGGGSGYHSINAKENGLQDLLALWLEENFYWHILIRNNVLWLYDSANRIDKLKVFEFHAADPNFFEKVKGRIEFDWEMYRLKGGIK